MNNYLSISGSDEDNIKRKQLQERHYKIFSDLQDMSGELPMQYQQRLPYELLSSLANCLLDDTIPQIVVGLKEIQKILEKSLYEKRSKTIDHLKASKLDLQRRNQEGISLRTMNQEEANKKMIDFDKYMENEIKKLDMKIIDEIDQSLKEQQLTLEKAGVPGFYITDKPNEIRLQMYLIDFILRV